MSMLHQDQEIMHLTVARESYDKSLRDKICKTEIFVNNPALEVSTASLHQPDARVEVHRSQEVRKHVVLFLSNERKS
jgi:hypothetical protein